MDPISDLREKEQVNVARVDGLREPFDGCVGLAEPGVHQGPGIGRDVSRGRRVVQGPEHLASLIPAPGLRVDVASHGQGFAVVVREASADGELVRASSCRPSCS